MDYFHHPLFSLFRIYPCRDLIEIHNHCGKKAREKEAFHGIVMITCLSIWKARNNTRGGSMISKPRSKAFLAKLDLWVFFGSRIYPSINLCIGRTDVNL
ncbi:hypothetical protein HanIR_Chr08g0378051 [Helianthus annuus]|nr:hypothetical protein HanIR_Chr08g0378051 [Helianthus annuus]